MAKAEVPYEAALALAGSENEATAREAIDQLTQLGARPAAAIVAWRLRELEGCAACPADRGRQSEVTPPV